MLTKRLSPARFPVFFFLAVFVFLTEAAWTLPPSDVELQKTRDWARTHFSEGATGSAVYPFSFVYNGVKSSEFLPAWSCEIKTESLDTDRTLRIFTFREPDGPLEVECRLTEDAKFPVIEWTLFFRNRSESETPVIESIQVLDAFFPAQIENYSFTPLLHHSIGSPCLVHDYIPKTTELLPLQKTEFMPGGGRSSNWHLPYYNLQSGRNAGWIFAIGWGGEWRSVFEETEKGDPATGIYGPGTEVTAGQALTRFRLLPHEKVSSPGIVLLGWERKNWIEGQNLWRTWMIARSLPTINGKVDRGHLWASTDRVGQAPFNAGQKERMEVIDQYIAADIHPDYIHIDAGWYPCDNNWAQIGTWEVDKTRYPDGIRAVFDYAEKRGIGSVLWFEPERVAGKSWLAENHPEWCSNASDGGLFRYHIPEAFDWMLERIDQIITDEHVDFYRQDFNMPPLDCWRAQDAPDREGITEIRHIESYYRLWDELKKRHPNLKFDACASGGRRNDYLTMRRAVPLCRSDYTAGSLGRQVQSYGAHLWIPFTGSGYGASTAEPNYVYNLRSWAFAPYSGVAIRIAPDEDLRIYQRNAAIWRKFVLPYFDDDYYPLTPCSLSEKDWIGWQYHDAANNSGVVQMFRRPESEQSEGTYPLFGLDSDRTYLVTDVDTDQTAEYAGEELMTKGLPIKCDAAPQALVLSYRAK